MQSPDKATAQAREYLAPDLRSLPLRPLLAARAQTFEPVAGRSTASEPLTACAFCPAAQWYSAPSAGKQLQLHAYCRVMHLLTWAPGAERQLSDCDGLRVALEEARENGPE